MNDDIEAEARNAMDECPRCRGLDPAGREARVREIIADVLASRARAAASGVGVQVLRPLTTMRRPQTIVRVDDSRSGAATETTRARATRRARSEPDWVPSGHASRTMMLGWFDAHVPGHPFTTEHPRAQIRDELAKAAA